MKLYPQPVYDLDELARRNLHVHTIYSACAKRTMTLENIVREADRLGLEMIALTDHGDVGYDATYQKQIETLRREYAGMDGVKVKVLFSSELSCIGPGRVLENDETVAMLDYRLYTCNHFHVHFWEQPEDRSPRGYALFSMLIVKELLKSGRADCIAHPLMAGYIDSIPDKTSVTKEMQDNEIGELCELARDSGTALELHTGSLRGDPELNRRLFNLGREAGTTFHFGTDAHAISSKEGKTGLDTQEHLPRIKKILL